MENFAFAIAPERVKRNAGQCRAHLEMAKTGARCGSFAMSENKAAEPAARPLGVNVDAANLRSVRCGIEERHLTIARTVAATECLAFAPTTTTCKARLTACRLRDEVRLISDELCIEAESMADGSVNLLGSVVVFLQVADGRLNQFVERGYIGNRRRPQQKFDRHSSLPAET